MALADYDDLLQATTDWLEDRTDLAPFAPDFVVLAENWLNYGSDTSPPLRTVDMEASVILTPANGVAPLPADFLEYLGVASTTGYRRPLAFVTPDQALRTYPSGTGGSPAHFSVYGGSLTTYPMDNGLLELRYYQRIPALSQDNQTNWLMAKSPSLYLRATLAQAAEFLKDDGEASKQFEMARALMAGLNHSSMMSKYGRAGISMRGPTP